MIKILAGPNDQNTCRPKRSKYSRAQTVKILTDTNGQNTYGSKYILYTTPNHFPMRPNVQNTCGPKFQNNSSAWVNFPVARED